MNAANDRFRQAALSERGLSISAGAVGEEAASTNETAASDAARSELRRRFRAAALAEYGLPISAGGDFADDATRPLTALSLFAHVLEPIIQTLLVTSDGALVDRFWQGGEAAFREPALAGATRGEVLSKWVRTEVPEAGRSSGDIGKAVLTYLGNDHSGTELERVAFVTQFLASHFTRLQNVDIDHIAMLAVLALRWHRAQDAA